MGVFKDRGNLFRDKRRANEGRPKSNGSIMNPPSSHPATRSHGSVPPPLVEETDHICLDRPGRFAPAWLEEFLSGGLFDYAPLALDVGCANYHVRRETANAAGGNYPVGTLPPELRHELLLKGHQSYQGESSRRADGRECDEVYSCVCQNCRYHFTFYIDRNNGTSCGLNRNNFKEPFHHLVFLVTDNKPSPNINLKYYPYRGHSDYTCSAKDCGFKLTIEVSLPRLDEHFLAFLTDNDRINKRLELAVEREPERFADVVNVGPNALSYLRIYLRDIVEGKKDMARDGLEVPRQIDQRNKKFFVQFGDGPDAAELFEYLEFEEVVDGDNRAWKVPSPVIARPTRPGSQLAFYQDIKSEVETIIGKGSQNMKPNTAINFLKTALDIGAYATSDIDFGAYIINDFKKLGLMYDMHEAYFWYAFSCQRQADPSNQLVYFAALQRLARGRNNEELELRVQSFDSMLTDPIEDRKMAGVLEEDEIRRATELSLQEMQPAPAPQVAGDDSVTAAYNYFGLPPDQPLTDEDVLGKYESLCDTYPSQKSSYREKLLRIARHTGSKSLQERALRFMDLEEALSYLGVQADTETEYIVNIAQYVCNSREKDYVLVATALRVIGMARNNDPVLLREATIVVAESDQSYQVDSTHFSQMDLDVVPVNDGPANLTLPVGLQNIRNTCYLNSILQYLFTVKPVREIVLDYDKYGLEITEDNLRSRRIDPGSTHLEKSEAFAGQQFVLQLYGLFQELLNSQEATVKPSQPLALAALKNPKQLEMDGATILEKEQENSVAFDMGSGKGTESPAPPLPIRHAPAPPESPRPTNEHRHSETKVVVNAVSGTDEADAVSTRSSQTLVNQTDDGWQSVSHVSDVATAEAISADSNPTAAVQVQQKDEGEEPPPYSAEDPQQLPVTGGGGDTEMNDTVANSGTSQVQEIAASGVQTVFDPPPPVAEPTVEEKIARALNDSSVTGTDQQDVEEVMGNIISHLRAAVRATGEDEETGVQSDPVTDTFFWTSVTYNRSNHAEKYNRQVAPNRWVTAYPDEGGQVINLLQALDSSFQREFITQGTTRYERFTSILKLPPILHVHIQRTTRDGGKNNTAIAMPVVLHLDRFMDSPVGSELFNKRRRAWNLQERLRSLRGPGGEVSDLTFSPGAVGRMATYTNSVVEEYVQGGRQFRRKSDNKGKGKGKAKATVDGTMGSTVEEVENVEEEETGEETDGAHSDDDDESGSDADDEDEDSGDVGGDYYIISDEIKELLDENGITIASTDTLDLTLDNAADVDNQTAALARGAADLPFLEGARTMTPRAIQGAWVPEAVAAGDALMANVPDLAETYRDELEGLFADLQDPRYEYLLHAVVCHAGQTGKSGHYWVWVFDFDQSLWRRYNDSVVTEEPDTDKVMKELSTQGEPYYLAYVRASDVGRMVNTPTRQRRAATPPPPPPRSQQQQLQQPLKRELSVESDFVTALSPPPVPPPTRAPQQTETLPPSPPPEVEEEGVRTPNDQEMREL
ncbi:ubiquitin hydrolase [Niveomyces insectorum RCEF 264]|uniref:ubiquitinyl hydrolase 1 n=1 Tax=Niveomyces insectorum RCEF 264 TaxID=1081102 RepID=A0A167X977_9HYPO|nr:ubiquitin hydrolase [Niveomyces insectorum RCEF 264]